MNINIYRFKNCLLFFSFFGVFLIFLFSSFIQGEKLSLCEIESAKLNALIEFEGVILSERAISDKTKILVVQENNCTIEVLAQTKKIFENQKVVIKGVVSEYDNRKQITAEKIKVIND